MAFEIRCPACAGKLELDEAPPRGAVIECPKCGDQFPAPSRSERPADTKAKLTKKAKPEDDDDEEEDEKEETPRKPKKKPKKKPGGKTPAAVIYLGVAGGLSALFLFGLTIVIMLHRAGSAVDSMVYIPKDYPLLRGVNLKQMDRMPGYKKYTENFFILPAKLAVTDLAKAANRPPEGFVSDFVIARRSTSHDGTIYVYKWTQAPSIDFASKIEGAKAATVAEKTCYVMPSSAQGILSSAIVYSPSREYMIVVPTSTARNDVMTRTIKAIDSKETVATSLTGSTKMAIKGYLWVAVNTTGTLKSYPATLTEPISEEVEALHKQMEKTSGISWWLTPSSAVRLGFAVDAESSESAKGVVKGMQAGRYGKADDSKASHKLMRLSLAINNQKMFGEFMQYCEFKSVGATCFMTSAVSLDNADMLVESLVNPNVVIPAPFMAPPTK